MLHAARPRGPIRGHRRASGPGKQRERFETETRAEAAAVGRACRHAAPARPARVARRCIRARLPNGLQSPHSAAFARMDVRPAPAFLVLLPAT